MYKKFTYYYEVILVRSTRHKKDDSSLWTIIILCMPMVNMFMAISGVNHNDLYNMHNYMCGNMAGCLCFTLAGTVGSTALVYLMGFRDNAGPAPQLSVLI